MLQALKPAWHHGIAFESLIDSWNIYEGMPPVTGVPSSAAAAGHVCAAPEPEAAGRRRRVVPHGLVRAALVRRAGAFVTGFQVLVPMPIWLGVLLRNAECV